MSFPDEVVLQFEGAYGVSVVFEVAPIKDIALVVETTDQLGEMTEHTYLTREQALKLAHTILEVLK